MGEDDNKGLLPGEDFAQRVSIIFGKFDPDLLIDDLDRLSSSRLSAFLSSHESGQFFSSAKFSNVIRKTPGILLDLVDRGLPLQTQVSPGKTALGFGLSLGHEPLVHGLLDRGATLDRLGVGSASPLALLALLLKETGKTVEEEEATILRLARVCIERNVGVDGERGADPPLAVAGRVGNIPFAEMLLEAGARQARNAMGYSPIQVARANGQHEWASWVVAWQEAKELQASTPRHGFPAAHRRSL